ncbi:hypothetical protein HAX54_012156 [Datura stramonium]|uniref:Uncharacterized protein n=1 Tax=Datura stramonium TaxID=4076 RepID=A0ABS8RXL8_DATST|nr:hypothetical protein [Datura stramonium]
MHRTLHRTEWAVPRARVLPRRAWHRTRVVPHRAGRPAPRAFPRARILAHALGCAVRQALCASCHAVSNLRLLHIATALDFEVSSNRTGSTHRALHHKEWVVPRTWHRVRVVPCRARVVLRHALHRTGRLEPHASPRAGMLARHMPGCAVRQAPCAAGHTGVPV